MRVVAFDCETHLVRPALQAPPVVCLQACEAFMTPQGPRLGAGTVMLAPEGIHALVGWLGDPDVLLVGAETAFDVLAPVTTVDTRLRHMARELGLDPREPGADLLTRFADAYDADRVTDIIVREKLRDLARGMYRGVENGRVNAYNLAAIARKHSGIDIPDEAKKCLYCKNTGCPACPWRLRYRELEGVPLDRWPREPLEYARTDAVATAGSWVGQWAHSETVAQNFPGATMLDVFGQEFEEARAALWLKVMSCYGLRTDPKAIKLFADYVEQRYEAIADELAESGLLRRSYKRDMSAIRDWITKNGLVNHFTRPDAAGGPPAWSLARSCYDSAVSAAKTVEQAAALTALREASYAAENLLALGLTEKKETRDTKRAVALITEAFGGEPPVAPTCQCERKGTKNECKKRECPEGNCATDKDTCSEAAQRFLSLAALEPDPRRRGDLETKAELIESYADLSQLSKQLSTDIPILLGGAVGPIHTRYETIQETERTGSSNPNVQNQPRGGEVKCPHCRGKSRAPLVCDTCGGKGKIVPPGARECFVPRQGWVLIDSDYEMGELFTLAQTCYWLLGHSSLGDALKAGLDPHLIVAAQIEKISYAEALRMLKGGTPDEKKRIKNSRNCGKAVNFGRPGGLSAKTMKSYGYKSYGVSKTVEEWQEIIDTWNATWTEMPEFFRMVNSLESYPRSGSFNVRYPGIPGFRANTRYCSACNTFYQRFLAKVAKRAGWLIFRACYTDRASVLYGSRPVLFVHDQFFAETPDTDRAPLAAAELARLMNKAATDLMPDCPTKTEPILTRRWSKTAEAKYENGVMVPWEDERMIG